MRSTSVTLPCHSRIDNLASAAGSCADLDEAAALRKLGRRLRVVHREAEQFGRLVRVFRGAPESEWESLVTRHRPDLTSEFFNYCHLMYSYVIG